MKYDGTDKGERRPQCNVWPIRPNRHTFFKPTDKPVSVNSRDGDKRLVLGTRFRVSEAGKMTAFRFYQVGPSCRSSKAPSSCSHKGFTQGIDSSCD